MQIAAVVGIVPTNLALGHALGETSAQGREILFFGSGVSRRQLVPLGDLVYRRQAGRSAVLTQFRGGEGNILLADLVKWRQEEFHADGPDTALRQMVHDLLGGEAIALQALE